MTRLELIQKISERTGTTQAVVKEVIDALGQEAVETLQKGGEVVLPSIGKLVVLERKTRMARNPTSGAVIEVPACRVVKLRVTSQLKQLIK